ncbi:MAG: porin [Myxococcota bacterium]
MAFMKMTCAVFLLVGGFALSPPANATTQTSTVSPMNSERAPMPECGAPSPFERAPMPQGGAHNPLRAPNDKSAPVGPTPATSEAPSAQASRPRRFGDYVDGPTLPMPLNVSFNGYLRLIIEAIENDSRSVRVGRNDGFKAANARIGLRVARGDFVAYLSVDSAAGQRETFNDPDQDFMVRPRDLFIRYRLANFASITVGRFKMPYDLGQLETTPYRLFIDQPVASRGVLPTQGLSNDGIGQGRQLGAMIHRDRLGLDWSGFDIGYALAVTNGRNLELALNDNDRVAGIGRLSMYWAESIQLNLAGFFDNRTVGDLPEVFDEDVRGVEVSAIMNLNDFNLEGQLLYQSTDVDGRAGVEAWGAHAQVAYTVGRGFQMAYRLSYYDPINTDDAVTEHTAGVSYYPSQLPLRFMLNGTLALEQANARVDNNRLAFLTQFVF